MKTLLLIEDNNSLRRNIAEMLTLEGYRVLCAADGESGLKQLQTDRPDLILCDIMMPGMSGYELLAQIRSDAATASLPLIFLTAKGEMPDLRLGMSLGADDYLTKPVARLDLLAAVQTRLERHSQLRQVSAPSFASPVPLEKLGVEGRTSATLRALEALLDKA